MVPVNDNNTNVVYINQYRQRSIVTAEVADMLCEIAEKFEDNRAIYVSVIAVIIDEKGDLRTVSKALIPEEVFNGQP